MTLIRDGPMLFADEHEPRWHGKPIQQLVRSELIELIYVDEELIRQLDECNKTDLKIDDACITILNRELDRSRQTISCLRVDLRVARREAAELRIKLGEL